MAIAFRSITTAQGGPGTVINVPAGTINGDVLLLCGTNAGPYAYTTPTGWTLLENPVEGADGETALFSRVASSEPASYTLTAAGNIGDIVTMVCYSGATGGVRSHAQSVVASSTTGTAVAPSGVIATDMVVHFFAAADVTQNTTNIALTPPGGSWNTRTNFSYAKGGANTWGSAVVAVDQLGSSGTPAATSTPAVGWPIASVALMLTAASQTVSPSGIATAEAFGVPTVTVGTPVPASGPLRRFDPIEKVVKDTRSQALDAASTALARLGTHTHSGYAPTTHTHAEADVTSLTTDLAAKSAVGHTHGGLVNSAASLTVNTSNIVVNEPLEYDTAWTSIPFNTGWSSDATRVAQYRMMADGTVQMKGWAKKSSNPVNGETWMTAIPSLYRPLHTWSFLTPTPGRAYNGTQSVEIHSDGTGVLFDMAAAVGAIALDGIRYTALY